MTDDNSLETQRLNSQVIFYLLFTKFKFDCFFLHISIVIPFPFFKIESLKFALRYLRAENSHLKGRDAMSILNWHLQPNKPRTAKTQSDGELLKTVAQEAKSLLKVFLILFLINNIMIVICL